MKAKGTIMENKKEIILAVLSIVLLAGIASGYFFGKSLKMHSLLRL